MKTHFLKSQNGAAAVIVALLLTVLLGFVGFAIDIGNLYAIKTRMQNAVDAAVCGGGLQLPNQTQATSLALSLITNNGFAQNNNGSVQNTAAVTFAQDTVRNPTNAPEINCSLTYNAPTYFMGLFGISTVPIAAAAKAILQTSTLGGPFNYTLFSNKSMTLSGTKIITGSIHSNSNLTISGTDNIIGSAEGVKGVTISGSNTINSVVADTTNDITISGNNTIGSKLGGASTISTPDYSTQIENTAATNYGTSQTFSGTTNITGNIYVNGNVTMSGSTNSSGCILATGNITISGNETISGSNQLCLYSANGNITISGSLSTSGNSSLIIYAPNGSVTVSGSQNIHGRIIANQITDSGSLTIDGTDYPVTTLPAGKAHVKLIQ